MLDLNSPRLAFPIDEACKVLATSRQRLYDIINAGRIRTFKEGKRRYVSRRAIEDYISAQEQQQDAAQGQQNIAAQGQQNIAAQQQQDAAQGQQNIAAQQQQDAAA